MAEWKGWALARAQVAQDLATQAANDTNKMGKLVNWGKSLANKASQTTVDEAVKAVFKLALGLTGITLP